MGKRWAPIIVLQHTKQLIIEKAEDFFAWWAEIAFEKPYWCISATFVITLICCIGFLPGIPNWIDGADALYSLPYSLARSEGAVHRVLFNETNSRPTFILITGKTKDENIFTWEHLEKVKQLDKLIRGQIVDPKHSRRIAIQRRLNDKTHAQHKYKDLQQLRPSVTMSSNYDNSQQNSASYSEFVNDFIENKNNIHKRQMLIGEDRGDAGHEVLTFQDICVRGPFGTCSVSGIQEMGIFEMRELFLKPQDPPILYLLDGLVFNRLKKAFPPHYLLGKATEIPCTPDLPRKMLLLFYNEDQLMPGSTPETARANMSCITEVKSFQIIYEVFDSPALQSQNEDWEKVLVEVLSDNMEFGPLKVVMNAFRSRDDALRSSTSESSDILYVGLTFGFLLAYSTGLNFSCDLYRSKAYPALAGLLAATLGLIAGMGTISLCGIAFVPTALVCPFLVVGVGTDDMFVIINGYAMTYMIDSAKHRCILSLKDTGLGITMTTLTSLVSFLIGLNTGYLSIKNFCWFCGAGMFYGYIFVLTFFFAVHCLDARREEENFACLVWHPSGRREARRKELRKEGVEFHEGADITIFTLGALMCRRAEQNALRRYAKSQQQEHNSKLKTNETNNTIMVGETSNIQQQSKIMTTIKNNNDNNDWNDSQETRGGGGGEAGYSTPNTNDDLMTITDEHTEFKNLKKSLSSFSNSNNIKSIIKKIYNKIFNKLENFSDKLLTRVAIDAHIVGIENEIDSSPSNGILDFSKLDKEIPTTGNPFIDILDFPFIPLHFTSLITGERKLYLEEPKGNVGLKWHQFFMRYYGALLVHPISKIIVLVGFGIFMLVSIYGCIKLESGLDLKDLAPKGSYLNQFDLTQAAFFEQYDYPVDVFFPEVHEWWLPEAQQSVRDLEKIMEKSGSGKLVTNPFIRMLDDPELKPFLQSGDRDIFESSLFKAISMEGSKYKQFEQNFIWEATHLRAWKMQILPGPMLTSTERAIWMTQIRSDCKEQLKAKYPIIVMAWNYMMTFYESDLQINSSVTSNMLVAALTMLLIAMIVIPQLKAGLIVTLIMGMIDVGIVGFMYFWDVKLNMVSMICMLIAVGFSVDFSAHVCHTYMETEGQTRNQRVIESLVIMGNPVFHGASSSMLGILMLGFSESYIFRVFFKMMTLVMVLALIHSIIFLPVFLSLVSDYHPHSVNKTIPIKKILSTEKKYLKSEKKNKIELTIPNRNNTPIKNNKFLENQKSPNNNIEKKKSRFNILKDKLKKSESKIKTSKSLRNIKNFSKNYEKSYKKKKKIFKNENIYDQPQKSVVNNNNISNKIKKKDKKIKNQFEKINYSPKINYNLNNSQIKEESHNSRNSIKDSNNKKLIVLRNNLSQDNQSSDQFIITGLKNEISENDITEEPNLEFIKSKKFELKKPKYSRSYDIELNDNITPLKGKG